MNSSGIKFIRPTGDRVGDGSIQLSFTLPVGLSIATAVAVELCRKMNLQQIEVAHLQPLGKDNTYVQVFAKTPFAIELTSINQQDTRQSLSREALIEAGQRWKRRIVIVGACTGTDAHTIGLDAILNKKGYKGDKGLESYPCFKVINLGSQVKNRELIESIKHYQADVIMVSQIITHQNVHLHNLTKLTDMLEAADLRNDLLCLIGGPRITHEIALELGFDAGFGRGTTPVDVANYIVNRYNELPHLTNPHLPINE